MSKASTIEKIIDYSTRSYQGKIRRCDSHDYIFILRLGEYEYYQYKFNFKDIPHGTTVCDHIGKTLLKYLKNSTKDESGIKKFIKETASLIDD